MLRIHEIKLNIGEELEVIPGRILKKLGVKGLEIKDYQLIKESVDARNKSEIKLVYSVDFTPFHPNQKEKDLEENLLNRCKGAKLERSPDMKYHPVQKGREPMKGRPVIAGFGPCGMFAGLILAEMGYEPIILERGKAISERVKDVDRFWAEGILDEESNVQFGEGGAGLFSDGKLTTQIKDPRIRKVLEEFVEAGGPAELLYKQKPHIGTDILRKVVWNIRKKIQENGGEVFFQSRLTGLHYSEVQGKRKLERINIGPDRKIETETLVLAIGHSARETFRLLHENGIEMSRKPFSIGVRIEHPQSLINEAQYGQNWKEYPLGAADYKLSHHCENGRGVYTFCMCPGGFVIGAASQEGCVVTNGMSYHDRGSALANSALLVDVRTDDFEGPGPLAGIDFQEKFEKLAFQTGGGNYHAPAQKLKDFMKIQKAGPEIGSENQDHFPEKELSAEKELMAEKEGIQPTYRPGITWVDLSNCLPDFAVEAMREAIPSLGRKLRGFDHGESVMTGVETRSSSPVRILRDDSLMGSIEGIYPAGEGAGYAGGIVSAAVDGIRVAEQIIKRYQSLR